MVVLKQTGKGHGRKYKQITERESGMALEPSLCAYLHYSENLKTQNLLIRIDLLTLSNVYRVF